MRELLYRPSWQSLRVGLLQENANDGGWTTIGGTLHNIDCLNHYIDRTNHAINFQALTEARAMDYSERVERSVRLHRVINLLNATRMGFSGQGLKHSTQDVFVQEYRDALNGDKSTSYHDDLQVAVEKWDWEVIKRELKDQHDMHRVQFDMVRRNLIGRFSTANTRRTNSGKVGAKYTRPELLKYLDLMDEVNL